MEQFNILFPIDSLFEFFQLIYILRSKGSYKAVFYKEAPVFLSSKSKSIGNCKKQINWKTTETHCGFSIDLLFIQLIYFLEAQERGKGDFSCCAHFQKSAWLLGFSRVVQFSGCPKSKSIGNCCFSKKRPKSKSIGKSQMPQKGSVTVSMKW